MQKEPLRVCEQSSDQDLNAAVGDYLGSNVTHLIEGGGEASPRREEAGRLEQGSRLRDEGVNLR